MSEGIDEEIIEHTTGEVIEEMVSEEREAEKPAKCRYCGESVAFTKLMSHYRDKHPDKYREIMERRTRTRLARLAEGRAEEPEKVKPTTALTEDDIKSIIAMEGREGLNRLKRQRLDEVLRRHPRITPKMHDWILFIWDTNESVKEDPNYLFSSIREAGVEPAVAKSIVDAVWSLEYRYANLLMSHGIVPKWPTYPQTQPYQPYMTSQTPQPSYYPEYQPRLETRIPLPPSYTQPQPTIPIIPSTPQQQAQTAQPITREEIAQIVRDTIESIRRRDRLQAIEEEVAGLKEYIEERLSTLEGKAREPERETQAQMLLKKIEDLERQVRENERKYYETQIEGERKLYEERLAMLNNELKNLRERIADMMEVQRRAETVSGYRSDVYRLLGQVSETLVERRPVEMIARALFPERFVGPPTAKGPTVEQKYLRELANRGLVE
ncbi:MAG: hypothetical protein QXE50_05870 [Nitrososphaerota archaeon]